MKRIVLFSIMLACSVVFSFAQKKNKIHIEDLKAPRDTLPEEVYKEAWKNIVQQNNHLHTRKYNYRIDTSGGKPRLINTGLLSDTFNYNIVAKSKINKPLVISTLHPFYDGMYRAYADHRPFVLSPDMIWLLIAQGFAQHINNNAEKLRHYFVQFKGKKALTITNELLNIHNATTTVWEKEAFPVFTRLISNYAGRELTDVLTNNFSTSTPATIASSQITIMESTKSYFDYAITVGCGIPDITLEGTAKDWESIRAKANFLKKYDLSWWIDSIDPILQKIVEASKGKIDKGFWRNMFKYHSVGNYGGSISNGWIVKFFPYDKDGHRNKLTAISGSGMLPPEIVDVPLKYTENYADRTSSSSELEFWAGFVGLEQDKKDFTLKPQIGWMIRQK